MPKVNPLVSVIIPAFNEQDVIARLLSSLRHQTHSHIEAIVVDDSSTDTTAALAKKLGAVVYTRPHAERSMQRNYGARRAKGSYLLFLDADMHLSPHVIRQCLTAVKTDTHIGAVVIPEVSQGERFWEQVKAFERSFYKDSLNFNVDAARFFTRQAFFQVGGYDETITGPEDWDLSESVRKQGIVLTKISAPLYHQERIPSLWRHCRKFYYYGLKSHRALSKQHQGLLSSKTLPVFRPEFFRHWPRLLTHPILTLGLALMLTGQIIFGGLGFLVGKVKNA